MGDCSRTESDLLEVIMNYKELMDRLMLGPVEIEFNEGANDLESYPEPRMRATITQIVQMHDDVVTLHLDYSKYDTYNKQFEGSNYFNRSGCAVLTARQADQYKVQDHIYVMGSNDISKHFTMVNLSAFEKWWASYWKRTSQPEVFDLAIKEIAEAAWDKAFSEGYTEGRIDGYDEGYDERGQS
jgi:hypothetical protein